MLDYWAEIRIVLYICAISATLIFSICFICHKWEVSTHKRQFEYVKKYYPDMTFEEYRALRPRIILDLREDRED